MWRVHVRVKGTCPGDGYMSGWRDCPGRGVRDIWSLTERAFGRTGHCKLETQTKSKYYIQHFLRFYSIETYKTTLTCFAISLRQATPISKFGNTMDPYFLHSGTGRIFRVTSVTTPSVPIDILHYIWTYLFTSFDKLIHIIVCVFCVCFPFMSNLLTGT